MGLLWEQVIVDSVDPVALGHWWAEALGWVVTFESEDELEIRESPERLPGLVFVPVPDRRVVKNRLHLDFRPSDQSREVERLIELGASRVELGDGDHAWVVLADPEGNEFCVLSASSPTA